MNLCPHVFTEDGVCIHCGWHYEPPGVPDPRSRTRKANGEQASPDRNVMANRKKSPSKRPKTERTPRAKKKAHDGAKPDVKVERFKQNMRCELSEAEILERSRRVSRQLSEKALRVEAAKSATAHLKAEIKQIDAEISRLSQEINDGACFREVDCERRYVYRLGKVVEVRCDTDAVTYERPMSGSERQLELPAPGEVDESSVGDEPAEEATAE